MDRSSLARALRAAPALAAFLGALPGTLVGQDLPACPPTESACEQVRAIAEDPRVRRAFAWLEENDSLALADLVRLTEIPAPPFGEGPRAQAFARLLRAAGADSVWLDEEGNVLALRRGRGGDSAHVAVAGHLDTVFPEDIDVTVSQRGDTLFAPGIGDDTQGLIVVLSLLRALEAAGVETRSDVLFIGTVGEEGLGDLRGVKHLFREGGPPIGAFIAVDGGDPDNITSMALGSRRYRLAYAGPGGHSWGAFGTANPAHALGRAIHHFDGAAAELVAEGPRTSYNVGRIGGGTSINAVPFEAWAEVDMRSESPERLLAIDSLFQAVARRALDEENADRSEGPPLELRLELVGDRPSGETPPDAPLVARARAATVLMGGTPELRRSSTDANVPIARGVPAITIGRGGEGGNAHSPDEWFIPREAWRASQRALLILLAQAGLPGA